ncbi:hypothetical protein XM53_08355 [Roseovarius atlanticus]|uniref:Uncharacterized protein n=1 Tax=Roseovarius atlanticus TaxID=1641875 RepID=A0A0T5NWE5_9RHOB|nr:hypothetical protein [Roseovarius atlanticus]KRS13148.1 hypothetical protein XM53_08355 [Roseovarius atlanticus]
MYNSIKYIAFGLGVVFLVVAGYLVYAVKTLDLVPPVDTTAAHTEARQAFLADLPDTDCVRAADITGVARARGWNAVQEPHFDWCVTPDTVQTWLRVTVEPALPFSTEDENAQIFAFDNAGCAVDWSYASGPGSTCAE